MTAHFINDGTELLIENEAQRASVPVHNDDRSLWEELAHLIWREGAASAFPTFDDRTEKNLATLLPPARSAARRFMMAAIEAMSAHGVDVKIISGTRTYAEQDAMYAQGRTKPGKKVTNARGGYSWHNHGVAFDIGLFKGGDYLEESPLYRECGAIGRKQGLEWGGDWASFPDAPHFQLKTGLTLAEMRERVANGEPVV